MVLKFFSSGIFDFISKLKVQRFKWNKETIQSNIVENWKIEKYNKKPKKERIIAPIHRRYTQI